MANHPALESLREHRRLATSDLGEIITSGDRFAVDANTLYVYANGVYRIGEQYVHGRVKSILRELGRLREWNSGRAQEVVRYIATDAPALLDRPPEDVINLENGLLQIRDRALMPHTSEFRSRIQLPIIYDPGAGCPDWEDFLADVFPADSRHVAWEILAWAMTTDTSIQKSVLLTGEGSNGKSTFLRALSEFLGEENVSAVSLQQLEEDRFSRYRLLGKLANICGDLPERGLNCTSAFKGLTGEDRLLAEQKFKESFEFVSYAKLLFSSNKPPRTKDSTFAFFRRWLVVPFRRKFEQRTNVGSRFDGGELLASPGERSGALNRALDALSSIRQNGFSESKSTARALEDFRQAADPLATWLEAETSASGSVPQELLHTAYLHFCSLHDLPNITKKAFGSAFKQLRPNVQSRQRRLNGKPVWHYIGICLRDSQRKALRVNSPAGR